MSDPRKLYSPKFWYPFPSPKETISLSLSEGDDDCLWYLLAKVLLSRISQGLPLPVARVSSSHPTLQLTGFPPPALPFLLTLLFQLCSLFLYCPLLASSPVPFSWSPLPTLSSSSSLIFHASVSWLHPICWPCSIYYFLSLLWTL